MLLQNNGFEQPGIVAWSPLVSRLTSPVCESQHTVVSRCW